LNLFKALAAIQSALGLLKTAQNRATFFEQPPVPSGSRHAPRRPEKETCSCAFTSSMLTESLNRAARRDFPNTSATGHRWISPNKARVIEESSRSLSSTLKETVEKFGDQRRKRVVLSQLNDIDHRLPTLGGAAAETISRIEKLFARAAIVEISDAVKLRAAQRAIDKRAPFHRQRNGIDDAILIETYTDAVREKSTAGTRFAFITHGCTSESRRRDRRFSRHDVASGRG
jgi:hypothetical protein